MKGIVFSEFLEMVEARYGLALVDRIIEHSNPASGGAYTAVGTYDPRELGALVVQLGVETGVRVSQLMQEFGEHLFGRLAGGYPQLLQGAGSAFEVLERIEKVIHPEVRKLYPDAELPRFETKRLGADVLELTYRSPRGLADLAEGLIRGCAAWYGHDVEIQRQDLSNGAHTHERFTLTRRS
jgi:hypothetical protein